MRDPKWVVGVCLGGSNHGKLRVRFDLNNPAPVSLIPRISLQSMKDAAARESIRLELYEHQELQGRHFAVLQGTKAIDWLMMDFVGSQYAPTKRMVDTVRTWLPDGMMAEAWRRMWQALYREMHEAEEE